MTKRCYSGSESEHVEQWLPAPFGWGDLYSVSSLGRVRFDKPTRIPSHVMRPVMGENYFHVRFYRAPIRTSGKTYRIHVLVATAFISGRPGPKHEVNHINGDPLDNGVENLEWVTKQENESHAAYLGVKRWKPTRGRLTASAVFAIRQVSTFKIRELAERFGVSQTTIYNVRSRQTWKHVA